MTNALHGLFGALGAKLQSGLRSLSHLESPVAFPVPSYRVCLYKDRHRFRTPPTARPYQFTVHL